MAQDAVSVDWLEALRLISLTISFETFSQNSIRSLNLSAISDEGLLPNT